MKGRDEEVGLHPGFNKLKPSFYIYIKTAKGRLLIYKVK